MRIIPKKYLGQNFLQSQKIIDQMIEALIPTSTDYVIEVGPGLGALTTHLIKKVGKTIAVEIDKGIIEPLKENLRKTNPLLDNIEIVNKDILNFRLPENKYKVIGSLPYYITSPIINHFIKEQFINPSGNAPSVAVFLVQKEVAEKICAGKGNMNVLALNIQTFAKPEIIAKVPRNVFWPEPEVDSAIIKLEIFDKPAVSCDLKLYFSLISRAFAGKRKKLSNTLREYKPQLEKLGLANKRPQELEPSDWEKLIQA